MLPIAKGPEPKEWVNAKRDARKTPDIVMNYENVGNSGAKGALLDALLKEQGYVCAYCTRRIHRKGDGRDSGSVAHVEHYLPRNPSSQLRESMPTNGEYDADEYSLEYRNMLAVCSGGEDEPGTRERICDKSRSQSEMLKVNPLDTGTVALVDYRRNGEICSSDPKVNDDLVRQLNLNSSAFSFPENRKGVIGSLDSWVQALPGGRVARRNKCQKLLDKLQDTGSSSDEVEPFLGVKLWRLRYWIHRWS